MAHLWQPRAALAVATAVCRRPPAARLHNLDWSSCLDRTPNTLQRMEVLQCAVNFPCDRLRHSKVFSFIVVGVLNSEDCPSLLME